jgi:cadmium resistance protein CadD (predicted permease)
LIAPFLIRLLVLTRTPKTFFWLVGILSATLAQLSRIVIAAVVAFAAANVGDLLVLLVFFADRRFRSWQVATGQYLGVGSIIGLCLVGAAPASHLPSALIRALGIVPIGVGIYKLVSRSTETRVKEMPLGFSNWAKVLTIAGISFADCSDNLAIFTPLFARSNRMERMIATLIFLLLIGVWCWFARYLTRHRSLGESIRTIGNAVAPWALIGLGLFIVLE